MYTYEELWCSQDKMSVAQNHYEDSKCPFTVYEDNKSVFTVYENTPLEIECKIHVDVKFHVFHMTYLTCKNGMYI